MTPLDASLPPPSDDRDAVWIIACTYPAEVVGAELPQSCEPAGIAMGNDGGRGVLQFLIDSLGRREEKQVAVKIGHPLRVRFTRHHEQRPRRRAGEVIFDRAAARTGSGDLG